MSKRRVAVVTGASRGIGRGIATALGERGWIVYVTGRSTGDGELTIDATARLVDECGGTGVPVATDHGDDTQIAALFERVAREQGHLDLLVNNVYTIPDPPAWSGGFWEHPLSIWDDQVGIGLRAHYVASWHAAPLLFAAAPGALIANISSPGGQRYHFNSAYGAGKAGLDRLTADMAIELRDTGVGRGDCVSRLGRYRVRGLVGRAAGLGSRQARRRRSSSAERSPLSSTSQTSRHDQGPSSG